MIKPTTKQEYEYNKAVLEESYEGKTIKDYEVYLKAKHKNNVYILLFFLEVLVIGIIMGYLIAQGHFITNCEALPEITESSCSLLKENLFNWFI